VATNSFATDSNVAKKLIATIWFVVALPTTTYNYVAISTLLATKRKSVASPFCHLVFYNTYRRK
jgi:HJR/Mrr/RecB family endonuclease